MEMNARTDWGRSLLGECARAVNRAERLVEEAEEERAMAVELYERAVDDRAAQRARIAKLETDAGTRWHELFGTPERAVETLRKLIEDGPFLIKEDCDSFRPANACDLLDELCGGCGKCPSCVNVHETEYSIKFECNGGDYDAMLEWLRGDA